MNSKRLSRRHQAFTIIEFLLVIAIIFILAALLLPALEQARSRTRQTQCLSQLKQIGVALHAFAHDHDSKFPFQTPANAGGTFGLIGDSAFHFRPLSNELEVASLFWCPSDPERFKAESFRTFGGSNVSYFLTRTAELGQADDVLAGDRNVDVNSGPAPRWMAGLHDRKGNLLFADGHVEKSTAVTLQQALDHPRDRANVVLPDNTIGHSSAARGTTFGSGSSAPGRGGGTTPGGAEKPGSGFAALQRVFGPAEPVGSGSSPGAGTAPYSSSIERSKASGSDANDISVVSSIKASHVTNVIRPPTQLTSAPPSTSMVGEATGPVEQTPLVAASMTPANRIPWWLLVLLLAVISTVLATLIARRKSQGSDSRPLS